MIQQATLNDLNAIMTIIKEAQIRMRKQGLSQWQNNYPTTEIIKKDIMGGHVFVYKTTHVIATMSVFDLDEVYERIEGKWLNDNPYRVIHRIAIADEAVGMKLSDLMYQFVIKHFNVKDIRIDTHKHNISMIKSLERNGFVKVGIVHVLSDLDSERLAYHLSV